MDAHLVSQASARLEPRDLPISYIILNSFSFFLCSLRILPSRFFPEYLNALCAGFHRSRASPSSMRCRETDSSAEVHVQSYRHPRCTRPEVHLLVFTLFDLLFTPVCLECSWEFGHPSLTTSLLSFHSVCSQSQSQSTSIRSPPAAVLFLTHALISSFLFSKDCSASIVILGFTSTQAPAGRALPLLERRLVFARLLLHP